MDSDRLALTGASRYATMTAEQRIDQVFDQIVEIGVMIQGTYSDVRIARRLFADAIIAAVAEQRERDANIVETAPASSDWLRIDLAAAIRETR